MAGFHIDGREVVVVALILLVTIINAIVLAGATSGLSSIYIMRFSDGEKVGFWATCVDKNSGCAHVINESPGSAGGALHSAFFVRYLFMVAAVLMAIILLTTLLYAASSSKRLLGDPNYYKVFVPLSVISLLLIGSTALVVSTLRRAFEDGSLDGRQEVEKGINGCEALLWVSFVATFLTMTIIIGPRGMMGQ